jgi:hypothetical protein
MDPVILRFFITDMDMWMYTGARIRTVIRGFVDSMMDAEILDNLKFEL